MTYQSEVRRWLHDALGPHGTEDKMERAYRFLEEGLELFQACGGNSGEVAQLTLRVFGRPAGKFNEEVGAVALTLAALCSVWGVSMENEGWAELHRVRKPEMLARIRAKNAGRVGPLPGSEK